MHGNTVLMLSSTRIIVVLSCILFIPIESFASTTKSLHDIHYKINPYVDIVPFLILGGIFMVTLYAYYKSSRVGKYEKFSLHCTKCGSFTRGLKCVICEARK